MRYRSAFVSLLAVFAMLERVMDFSEGPNLKKPLFRRTWRLLADDARPECVG